MSTGWLLGMAALAAAACAAQIYFTWESKRKLRSFQESETTTAKEVAEYAEAAAAAAGPGAFSMFVDLEGKAQPGPDGPVVSPISKTECVWYSHKVTREYEKVHTQNGRRRTEQKSETVDKSHSSDRFVLVDGDAQVTLSPGGTKIKGARKSVSEFRESTDDDSTDIALGSFSISIPSFSGGTLGYRYEEWVIVPGTRLYVQGEAADKRGQVVIRKPTDGRTFVMSTESEEEHVADAKAAVRKNGLLAAAAGAISLALLVAGILRATGVL